MKHYYFVYIGRPGQIDMRLPTGGVVVDCPDEASGSQVAYAAFSRAWAKFPRRPSEMLALRECRCRASRRQAVLMARDRRRMQREFESFMRR